jgi:signal transduction histidine kinase
VLGRGTLPDAEPFDLDPETAGRLDGQYVHVNAYAYGVGADSMHTALFVVTAAGRGVIYVPGNHRAALAPLVGKSVHSRAVCVPAFDRTRRTTGGPTRLWVSSPDAIREMPAEPPADPAPLAAYLRGYQSGPNPSARPVRLTGVVNGRIGPNDLFLQDDTGGALVTSAETLDGSVAVGDRIEARGFLRAEGAMLIVRNAIIRRVGPGRLPDPIPARLPLFGPETLGRLVTLEAVLEDGEARENGYVLNLRTGPTRFLATLLYHPEADRLTALPPGARLRLTGVPFVYFRSERQEGHPPSLVLRSPQDVAVIAPPPAPPWWTTPRVAGLALGFAAALMVIGLWVWFLRRQVAIQTAVIQSHYAREAKLAESLRQAKKLEAIGRLAAGISHDFNNLLTVILGNADLLLANLQRPADRDLARLIVQSGERAADLTRQLLTFSRQRPIELAPLDLEGCLNEHAGFLRRLAGAHIDLRVECEPALPAVTADKTLMTQVLMNLTANARDAMPSGGHLLLRAARAGNKVRLTVRDTGVGMDEATRSHLFEPFFTTKEVGKGTGLGLATVYGAAAALGAAVEVESAPGKGAAFHLDLKPATSEPAPAARAQPADADGAVVMLLDDDAGVREVSAQALRMYGYRVLTADRAEAALELAARPGRIDLLVSDLIMPVMNGKESAVAIRAIRPGLRVLFMSGYPPEEVARIVGDLPGFTLIGKPFTPLVLVSAVQEALAQE